MSTLFSLISKIYHYYNNQKIIAITEKSVNFHVHKTAHFEFSTVFFIKQPIKLFLIKENFICRNYCNFLVQTNASLIIHENVFLNNFCSINCLNKIEIGANTILGEGVKMYDHNHKYLINNGIINIERNEFTLGIIKIGKNCWIGSNVTILKDVEIGDNVIVGAGCLIHKSIPSNSIVKSSTSVDIQQYE